MIRFPVLASLLFAVSLVVYSGCGVLSKEPYVPTQYYDLGDPEPFPELDVRVDVRAFTCSGPYRNRMIYRVDSCKLTVDEYNRWIQPPNILLTRYLTEAFSQSISGDREKSSVLVGGDIVGFDIHVEQKIVRLIVLVEIIREPSGEILLERCISVTEPLSRTNPDAFAAAISGAAAKLAAEIRNALPSPASDTAESTPVEPKPSETVPAP
jgi:ABC-type uncharacterized transport system auxiliary subunit